MPILVAEDISKNFGGVQALRGISFSLEENNVLGLIGPNGSGKTTLLNVIAGVYKPTAGKVFFAGKRIDGLPADSVSQIGVVKTHQIPKPFLDMSVEENVATAVLFGVKRERQVAKSLQHADEVIELLEIASRKYTLARNLTVQEKKRLELARAIATGAKVILLDEVFSGLSEEELRGMIANFKDVRKELGLTIIVVEHVLKAVMGLAERVMVLHEGIKLADGEQKEVMKDAQVIQAYLGTDKLWA